MCREFFSGFAGRVCGDCRIIAGELALRTVSPQRDYVPPTSFCRFLCVWDINWEYTGLLPAWTVCLLPTKIFCWISGNIAPPSPAAACAERNGAQRQGIWARIVGMMAEAKTCYQMRLFRPSGIVSYPSGKELASNGCQTQLWCKERATGLRGRLYVICPCASTLRSYTPQNGGRLEE